MWLIMENVHPVEELFVTITVGVQPILFARRL
jgi:hypothetical protein